MLNITFYNITVNTDLNYISFRKQTAQIMRFLYRHQFTGSKENFKSRREKNLQEILFMEIYF
jgi:hypothetical protein